MVASRYLLVTTVMVASRYYQNRSRVADHLADVTVSTASTEDPLVVAKMMDSLRFVRGHDMDGRRLPIFAVEPV